MRTAVVHMYERCALACAAMHAAFLHGFAGDPAGWADIAGAGSRVALPGHGGGPVLATWAANLDAIAETIGACDVVVGYSLGARVALGLVAAGRVPRAILVGVNPGLDDSEREARRTSDARWASLLRERGIAAFVDAWEAQPLFATQVRATPERLAARRARRLALDPEQLARSLEAMGLAEMPDYRAAITAERCALIAGADDAKYLALSRSLPAPLEVIADCGHDATLEQPTALAAVLARLLHGK
jgi:2-succinyl-6-hydroxy-2,4-cyclohexadiene-1-carboxylate synthase